MANLIDKWHTTEKSILTDLNRRNSKLRALSTSYVDFIDAQLISPRSRTIRVEENGKMIEKQTYDQRPLLDYHVPRDVIKRTLLLCPTLWPLNIDFRLPEMTTERQQEIQAMQAYCPVGPYNMDLVAMIVGLAKLWLIETDKK